MKRKFDQLTRSQYPETLPPELRHHERLDLVVVSLNPVKRRATNARAILQALNNYDVSRN